MILKVGPDGIATVIAGNGIDGFSGEGGQATNASLSQPSDVVFDPAGNLYIADSNNNRIRKVDSTGLIRTIAGNGHENASGDGGPAIAAGVDYPIGLAFDAAGNLYESQYYEHKVRKISPVGIITTVAGNGNAGYSGDGGPATAAMLNNPYGIAVDRAGNLFIADLNNSRIRKVSPDGTITTVAGNGDFDNYGNLGLATLAAIAAPSGVAVDAQGVLYIADAGSDQVRKVNSDGIISLLAGTGAHGFSGDGGPATKAELAEPTGIAVDTKGDVFFTDAVNRRVRMITPDGIISTFAGNGDGRFAGDGDAALRAAMDFPGRVAFDFPGNLYISDTFNHRVRKVTPAGHYYDGCGQRPHFVRGRRGTGDRGIAGRALWSRRRPARKSLHRRSPEPSRAQAGSGRHNFYRGRQRERYVRRGRRASHRRFSKSASRCRGGRRGQSLYRRSR